MPAAVAATGIVLIGVFGAGIQVSVSAMLQRIVPNHMRGRVFGVHDLCTIGGLLLATGVLGIPEWKNIDRHIAWITALVSLMLLVVGIWTTMVRLNRGRWGKAVTFWVNVNEFYCRFWARTKRIGICTIPYDGPVIVAANHNSTLDPFVLNTGSPNRYISYLIAQEFARIPIFKWLVKAVDCVPVTRSGVDTASVKAALRHLQTEHCLGIFPQGRVQAPDEPIVVRDGVGMLALRSGATVVPAYISGIQYSPGVIGPLFRRQNARVRYGKPVDLSAWKGREKDREAYREVSEHIMRHILALRPPDEGPAPEIKRNSAEQTGQPPPG
jgi:1-acyl-sn-glycerol-3-phosphate acyltransferase